MRYQMTAAHIHRCGAGIEILEFLFPPGISIRNKYLILKDLGVSNFACRDTLNLPI